MGGEYSTFIHGRSHMTIDSLGGGVPRPIVRGTGNSRHRFGIARIIPFTAADMLEQRAAKPCRTTATEQDTLPNYTPTGTVKIGGSQLKSSAQFIVQRDDACVSSATDKLYRRTGNKAATASC